MASRAGVLPAPTQPQRRVTGPRASPAQPALARAPFRLSGLREVLRLRFEEGPASGPGRSRAAMCLSTHISDISMRMSSRGPDCPGPRWTLPLRPRALEAFEEILRMWGRLRPSCLASLRTAWCKRAPYPSQEHSPQVLVEYQRPTRTPSPCASSPESLLRSNFLPSPFQTFLLRVSVHLQAQRVGVSSASLEPPGWAEGEGADLARCQRGRVRESGQTLGCWKLPQRLLSQDHMQPLCLFESQESPARPSHPYVNSRRKTHSRGLEKGLRVSHRAPLPPLQQQHAELGEDLSLSKGKFVPFFT